MATSTLQYLYLLDKDLYRLANANSPKLHNVRLGKDVQTYDRNGIQMVRSTGEGVSLITEERLERARQFYANCYLWKLPANYPMPPGLALHADLASIRKPGDLPDHYFLCPQYDMPLSEYVALLSKLALRLERLQKL